MTQRDTENLEGVAGLFAKTYERISTYNFKFEKPNKEHFAWLIHMTAHKQCRAALPYKVNTFKLFGK